MMIDFEHMDSRLAGWLRFGLVVLLVPLVACTPEIKQIEVFTREDGQRFPPGEGSQAVVRTEIKTEGVQIYTPRFALRDASSEDNPFLPERDLTLVDEPESGVKVFEGGFLLKRDYAYHARYGNSLAVRIRVPYAKAGGGSDEESALHRFDVDAPLHCFSFDGDHGDEGWRAEGYFRGVANVREDGFPVAGLEWDGAINWPQPFDAARSGAILFRIDAAGLRGQNWGGGRPRDRYWSVELISPQMPGTGPRADWARLAVMEVRLFTEAEGLQAQGILEYQAPSRQGQPGEIKRWRTTVNGWPGSPPVFLDVPPGEWKTLRFSFASLPPGSKLLRVIVRIFGEPSALAASDGLPVQVDMICPVVRR